MVLIPEKPCSGCPLKGKALPSVAALTERFESVVNFPDTCNASGASLGAAISVSARRIACPASVASIYTASANNIVGEASSKLVIKIRSFIVST